MKAERRRCEALILEASLIATLRRFRRLYALRKYPGHDLDRRLSGFVRRLDVLGRCLRRGRRFDFEKRKRQLHGCSPCRRLTLTAASNRGAGESPQSFVGGANRRARQNSARDDYPLGAAARLRSASSSSRSIAPESACGCRREA